MSTLVEVGAGAAAPRAVSTLRRPRQSQLVLLICLSLAGTSVLLAATRWGIGTSPDSIAYIRAARVLAGDWGALFERGSDLPLAHFAPLYALLLALPGAIGVDPLVWARWMSATLFGLNGLLVGLILCRTVVHARWYWIFGVVLTLAALPVLTVHLSALSEPLFLFLTLAGLWLTARHVQSGARHLLLGGSVLLGLALLTRYAGGAGIMAATAAIVLFGRPAARVRLRDAAMFGLLGVVPMLAWMIRNALVAESATGRELIFHPVTRSHAWQAIYTASSWLFVPHSAADWVRLLAWGGIAAAAAVILVLGRANTPPVAPQASRELCERGALIRVLALFLASYAAFLAVSLSFFDANTPLDDRILSPAYIAGLLFALLLIDSQWPGLSRRRVAARTITTALILFSAGHVFQASRIVAFAQAGGWGFTSLAWQQSPTLAVVRSLPDGVTIYANAPDIVYLHTGRQARPVPRPWSPMTRRPDPEFGARLADMRRTLDAAPAVVVYFQGVNQNAVPVSELRVQLRVLADERDGEVLCGAACPR